MEKNTSIENISCALFDKICQTNDTSLLEVEEHIKVWENIDNELVDKYGISKEYKMYLDKMMQYVRYLNQAINGEDLSMINFANIYKNEGLEILEKINKNKDEKVNKYAIVSKFMGFAIKPTETTVDEFYGYLTLMK